MVIPHEQFEFMPDGFTKERYCPGFLFLNRGFQSTDSGDIVISTQARTAVALINQARD